ncbi:enoyl-CoA hydratase-related protein [Pseudomonas sp. TE21394]
MPVAISRRDRNRRDARHALTQHTALQTGQLFEVVDRCKKPEIGAIEDYALGGGCELALACNIIIASHTARPGQPKINVGIMPGANGA